MPSSIILIKFINKIIFLLNFVVILIFFELFIFIVFGKGLLNFLIKINFVVLVHSFFHQNIKHCQEHENNSKEKYYWKNNKFSNSTVLNNDGHFVWLLLSTLLWRFLISAANSLKYSIHSTVVTLICFLVNKYQWRIVDVDELLFLSMLLQ